MGRKVKCQVCLVQDEKETMEKLKNGYVHIGECHARYIEDQERKKYETECLDRICRYIMELHGLIIIPQAVVIRLQELRNGYTVQNGAKKKLYREGVPFDVIYDAYLLATESIRWCITNKLNSDNSVRSLNYCFSIMMGKINEAHQRKRNRIRQQESVTTPSEETHVESPIFMKKESNTSILDFLEE